MQQQHQRQSPSHGNPTSLPILEDVFLGKLRGFKYPSIEEENKLLQNFFKYQFHPLIHMHVIYVTHFIRHDIQVTDLIQEVVVFPYLISKLDIKVHESVTNNSDLRNNSIREVKEGIFSTSSSKVFLDGKHHQHSYHYSDVYSNAMLHYLQQHPTHQIPMCFMLPLLPRINNQQNITLFPLYVGSNEMDNDTSANLQYQAEFIKYQCVAKAESSIECGISAKQLLDILASRHSSTHSTKHQNLLLREGILLDLSARVTESGNVCECLTS